MSYTLKPFPNQEFEFPRPPVWLVWIEQLTWVPTQRGGHYRGTGKGQIRQYSTLQKAKKHVRAWNYQDVFTHNWAVYLWDQGEERYVLQYEGRKGDARIDSPLFRARITKDDEVRTVPESQVEAAIESILQVQK